MNFAQRVTFLSVIPLVSLAGCADLVVTDLDVTWDDANKTATAEVENTGTRAAGEFVVEFRGDEDPVSPARRPERSITVPGLGTGESVTLTADFAPLAHPDNSNLANVYQITVEADATGRVQELNEGNNTRSAPAGAAGACVDFGPPPAAGTMYGPPAGTVVLTTPDGIRMSVHDFRYVGGGMTLNWGRIELPPVAFGSGQTLRANNINFEFDFTGLGAPVSRVTFDYLDLGGSEDLSVNGQPVPIYAGELTAAPSPMGGATVAVTSVAVPGGKRGTVTVTGNIERIRVGGQEFWLDNVCAE